MIAALAGAFALSLSRYATPPGFLAEPRPGHGPGVLVLHPWWGLNGDVKGICTRLAGKGYVAFAPDLFEGKVVTSPAEALALAQASDAKSDQLKRWVSEGAAFLAGRTGRPGIGVVGLSFGAYYALELSKAEPDRVRAVVTFYGTGPGDFKSAKAAYLAHFAAKDEFNLKADVDAFTAALRAAGRPTTIETYPNTGHWFFEPSVKASYDKPAAELAWRRTLAFLKKNLPAKG